MGFAFDSTVFSAEDAEAVEQNELRFPQVIFKGGDMSRKPKKGQPDPGIAYRGGFFIAKESLPNVNLGEYGWIEDSFIGQKKGEEVEGWYAPMITVCHIEYRRCWVVSVNGVDIQFPWHESKKAKAAGKMRGTMQNIVLIKGLEEFGAFRLSLSGFAQAAYKGEGDYTEIGVMSSFRRIVLQKANDVNKEKTPRGVAAIPVPFYAFWMTMEASQENGEPKFFPLGKAPNISMSVLPVPVGLPKTAKDVNLDDFFVGNDLVYKAREVFQMLKAEGWKEAWANNSGSAEQAEQKAPVKATAEANYAEEAGV